MSEEPNRKIDELLKAYAKKRQDEAGRPEIHPATRKMLQDEVRRTFGTKQVPAEHRNPWIFLKFAIGAAACFLIIGVVLMTQRKSEPEFEVAKVSEAQPTLSKDKAARSVEAVTDSGEEMTEAARSESDVSLQGRTAPAPAAAPAEPLADRTLEERAAPALAKREVASKELSKDQSGATGDALSASAAATAPKVVRFVTPAARQRLAGAASTSSAAQPLANFQFEQTGDRVRIVDLDGSVYEGKLLVAAADAAEKTRAIGRADVPTTQAAAGRVQQTPQPLYFEVTGTNRTLQQPIRFAGTLTSTPAARPRAAAVETETKQVAPSAQLGAVPAQTVSGTLTIGKTNLVQINAVRAQP